MNEYLAVSIKSDLVQLCRDCYHVLGWTIINASFGIDALLVVQKIRRKKMLR
jgi:hypothetical protein